MAMNPSYYLPGANVPKIFLEADRQMNEANPEPKIITKPKEVPMPFIQGCKGAKGPIVITEDWYVKEKKKQLARIAENKKDAQIEMMQLIADRDRLRYKLGKLDGSKKKDSKMIVAINVKLRDIDAELKALQDIAGVNIENLDKGSKLGRFVGRIKKIFKTAKKAVKRWYQRNEAVIKGVAAIVLPVLLSALVKKIVGLFA